MKDIEQNRLHQSCRSGSRRSAACSATVRAACWSRRAVLAGLAAVPLSLSGVWARADGRRKMTVRDVVRELFRAEDGKRVDLSGSDLSGLDLSNVNFRGADLSRCNLFGSDLTSANLAEVNLTEAVLDRTVLVRTNFRDAVLRNASILRPSVAPDLEFIAGDLPSFRNADLRGVRITARLGGADFANADLSDADFAPATERGLGGTPTHGLARTNFAGAKLVKVNMAGVNLAFSTFRGADLRDANLSHADLSRADLTGANLAGADLTRADLTGADLTGAILTGALLTGAKFEGVAGAAVHEPVRAPASAR